MFTILSNLTFYFWISRLNKKFQNLKALDYLKLCRVKSIGQIESFKTTLVFMQKENIHEPCLVGQVAH